MAVILVTGLSTLTLAKANNQTEAGYFKVNGYSAVIHKQYLAEGDYVDIELEGDGDTDLDVYIYDAYGNLIAYSENDGDFEFLDLEIYRSETFTIKVVNRGSVYNNYSLSVYRY